MWGVRKGEGMKFKYYWPLACCLSATLWMGCDAGEIAPNLDDTDDSDTDDTDVLDAVEADCTDGIDDDGDGDIDCDDSDCDAVQACQWPDQVQAVITIDVDVTGAAAFLYDDCFLMSESELDSTVSISDPCVDCDRTYQGPLSYTQDTCDADLFERPTEGSAGLVFLSDTEWEIWMNLEGDWEKVGVATKNSEGVYVAERSEPIVYEGVDLGSALLKVFLKPVE